MAFPQSRIVIDCDYSKQFCELYFNKFDKSRHTIDRLFHAQGTLLWDGSNFNGAESIASFLKKLPTTSSTFTSIDGQPILDLPFFNGQQMILIICMGKMTFAEKKVVNFTSSFTLIAEDSAEGKKWKILNQTFRTF